MVGGSAYVSNNRHMELQIEEEPAIRLCTDLSSDTNAVADLYGLHILANFDGLADNFVSDANRKTTFALA